jgi:mannose-6-phosphate isomerase-like protein (cupin superfamily)
MKSDVQSDEVLARYEDGAGGYIEIFELGDSTAPCRYRMRQSPGVGPPASEYHPSQHEAFDVLRGTLDLGVIDGQRVRIGPGERFELPPSVPHLPSAAGGEPVEYEATLTPGLSMAQVFEALFRAEREHRGLGKVMRIARTLAAHRDTMRLTQPFSTVMSAIALFARVLGVRHEAG